MEHINKNDILLKIEKEFPDDQREQVLLLLEPFVQDNQYIIHELILDRAHGNMREVERMVQIAKGYAFDPRDRWEILNNPDGVFKGGLNWVNKASPRPGEENIRREAPVSNTRNNIEQPIKKEAHSQSFIGTLIGSLFILMLAGYFLVKSMMVISVECEKSPSPSSKVTCTQSNQVFGFKFGIITYPDVIGARLDSYTEHQPGKGWYTYYRVALITPQAEFFLTDGSQRRASEEKAVDQINQYVREDNQSNLTIALSPESDWIYFVITIVALGYIGWNYLRKRKG